MATPRYSSLWERWVKDDANVTQASYETWYAANFSPSNNRNANSWHINPWTFAQGIHLFIAGEFTQTQLTEHFGLSDHEVLQATDVRDWVITGTALEQLQNSLSLHGMMQAIEDGALTKTFVYSKFSIRADVASG